MERMERLPAGRSGGRCSGSGEAGDRSSIQLLLPPTVNPTSVTSRHLATPSSGNWHLLCIKIRKQSRIFHKLLDLDP